MPIRINIDQIPFAARQDQRFRQLFAEMTQAFTDPSYLFEVCLHEAAHEHYMKLADVKNLKLYAPAIKFDPTRSPPFFGESSRIAGDDSPDGTVVDLQFVMNVAKVSVAGEVVIRKLLGVQYGGDEQDKLEFFAQCTTLPLELRHLSPEGLWQAAEAAVEKDLHDPNFEAALKARAAEFVRGLQQIFN